MILILLQITSMLGTTEFLNTVTNIRDFVTELKTVCFSTSGSHHTPREILVRVSNPIFYIFYSYHLYHVYCRQRLYLRCVTYYFLTPWTKSNLTQVSIRCIEVFRILCGKIRFDVRAKGISWRVWLLSPK